MKHNLQVDLKKQTIKNRFNKGTWWSRGKRAGAHAPPHIHAHEAGGQARLTGELDRSQQPAGQVVHPCCRPYDKLKKKDLSISKKKNLWALIVDKDLRKLDVALNFRTSNTAGFSHTFLIFFSINSSHFCWFYPCWYQKAVVHHS